MSNNKLLASLISLGLLGCSTSAAYPSSKTQPNKPAVKKQTQPKTANAVSFTGPYTRLEDFCAKYKKDAMASFSPEQLAEWRKHGYLKYPYPKAEPFTPQPRCSVRTKDVRNSQRRVFVSVSKGGPFDHFDQHLLVIRVNGVHYVEQPGKARHPWSAELHGRQWDNTSWTLRDVNAGLVAWNVVRSRGQAVCHGGRGSSETISYVTTCNLGGKTPSCSYKRL